MAAKAAEPATPDMVTVTIHPRKSAVYQVQIGTRQEDGKDVPIMANRLALGGTTLEVSPQDAEHMREHGFTVTPEELAAHREMAAQLAAAQKQDFVMRHSLREEVPGNVGLQRAAGAMDTW